MGGDAEAPEGASARMADEAAMPRDSGWASLRSSGHLSFDGEDGDFAANLSSGISLAEHLTSQLNLEFTAPADLMIGQHLIGMLNDAGYLSADPATLCETIKATPEQVEAVLDRMRRFEPAGVFARDLAECLRLQLLDLDHLDPAMAALVDNLPLVARRDFAALKAKCGVTMEDLQDMLANCAPSIPSRALPSAPSRRCPWCPMSSCALARWQLDRRTEQRDPAARARQQPLHGDRVEIAAPQRG
jgi:RNA polymerase sigma-54 factor